MCTKIPQWLTLNFYARNLFSLHSRKKVLSYVKSALYFHSGYFIVQSPARTIVSAGNKSNPLLTLLRH